MKKVIYFLLAIVLLQTTACKKETNGNTTTVTTVPVTPSGLTAQLSSVTKVNLTWTDNSTNEDGFKIERKTDNTVYVQIGSTATNITSFIDTTLQLNTKYTYRIYAYNTVGNSPTYSNEVNIETSDSSKIYIVGYDRYNGNNFSPPFLWFNGIYTLGSQNTFYYDIFVSGNDVYTVGRDENDFAAIWKNDVKTVLSNYESVANSVFISGNDVYVAGNEQPNLGIYNTNAVLWKNGIKTILDSSSSINTFSYADKLFVSGNDVYVSGYSAKINKLVYWKNGLPIELLGCIQYIGRSRNISVIGSDVYIAGRDSLGLAVWKNGQIFRRFPSIGNTQYINTCFMSGSDAYMGGREDINLFGVIWKNDTKIYNASDTCFVENIYVSGNNVYAAGRGSGSTAVYWKNGVRKQLSKGNGPHSIFVVP